MCTVLTDSKGSKMKKNSSSRKRDLRYIANVSRPKLLSLARPVLSLKTIQDRRMDTYPLRRVSQHRIITSAPIEPRFILKKPSVVSSMLMSPALPKNAVVCVRRKIRKEVLFALGKGGSKHKRHYRRSETSKIVCR